MPSDPVEARQLQAVLDDFKDFVGRVRWYSARGVPYRRGYLLYGNPGCGKTTFTKVLAGRVGSDLYVLDLKSAAKIGVNDANISDIVRSLPPRSILLLKNIDASVCKRGSKGAQDDAKTTAAADEKDRKEEETGAKMDAKRDKVVEDEEEVNEDDDREEEGENESEEDTEDEDDDDDDDDDDEEEEEERKRTGSKIGYSAMLNMLDGALANSCGLTIIMTTNKYEKLMSEEFRKTSEALFRPGRVDMRAMFSPPDAGQIEHEVRKIFGGMDSLHTPEAVQESARQLCSQWPMAPTANGRLLSTHSFQKLKSHLLLYGHKAPEECASNAAMTNFRSRLTAEKLETCSQRAKSVVLDLEALAFPEGHAEPASHVGFGGGGMRGRGFTPAPEPAPAPDPVKVKKKARKLLRKLERAITEAGEPTPLSQDALDEANKMARKLSKLLEKTETAPKAEAPTGGGMGGGVGGGVGGFGAAPAPPPVAPVGSERDAAAAATNGSERDAAAAATDGPVRGEPGPQRPGGIRRAAVGGKEEAPTEAPTEAPVAHADEKGTANVVDAAVDRFATALIQMLTKFLSEAGKEGRRSGGALGLVGDSRMDSDSLNPLQRYLRAVSFPEDHTRNGSPWHAQEVAPTEACSGRTRNGSPWRLREEKHNESTEAHRDHPGAEGRGKLAALATQAPFVVAAVQRASSAPPTKRAPSLDEMGELGGKCTEGAGVVVPAPSSGVVCASSGATPPRKTRPIAMMTSSPRSSSSVLPLSMPIRELVSEAEPEDPSNRSLVHSRVRQARDSHETEAQLRV